MVYNVISTGSKGNAVIINNNILIDCGVPFKALEGHHKNLQLVLLTHIHIDHFKANTVRKLAKERPTLRWGVPRWLLQKVLDADVDKRNIDVMEMHKNYNYGILSTTPFPLVHDVPNCGYKIYTPQGKVFYATDTNTLESVEAKGYDLYMVEANYGEKEIVERIRAKEDEGLHCYEWKVLKNHLSKEKADDFLYANMESHSQYVYLHQHTEKATQSWY